MLLCLWEIHVLECSRLWEQTGGFPGIGGLCEEKLIGWFSRIYLPSCWKRLHGRLRTAVRILQYGLKWGSDMEVCGRNWLYPCEEDQDYVVCTPGLWFAQTFSAKSAILSGTFQDTTVYGIGKPVNVPTLSPTFCGWPYSWGLETLLVEEFWAIPVALM